MWFRKTEAEKRVERLAKRDGWTCHYCNVILSYPKKILIGYEYHDDFWQSDTGSDMRPGNYPIYNDSMPEGAKLPTIDHKIPRAKGGNSKPDNLVLSCLDCNMKKGARYTYEEFLALKSQGAI